GWPNHLGDKARPRRNRHPLLGVKMIPNFEGRQSRRAARGATQSGKRAFPTVSRAVLKSRVNWLHKCTAYRSSSEDVKFGSCNAYLNLADANAGSLFKEDTPSTK